MNEQLEKWNKLIKRQDKFYHQCAKKCGLSDAQFWVLYALCEDENGYCQNAFCENWCYSKQTVSAAVASLEKSGLVKLTYTIGSRKQKDLNLTQKGEDFCKTHIKSIQDLEQKVMMSLSNDDREAFFRILEYLINGLENELA